MAAIWMMIVQWVSAAVGGYLTGRLRKRWAGVHTHEAFFRDTAHGFIAWSAATMITAGSIILRSGGRYCRRCSDPRDEHGTGCHFRPFAAATDRRRNGGGSEPG